MEIPNRRCGGPARACGTWPTNCAPQGHPVSHMLVADLMHKQKYSLPANRKTREGTSHPDRNAQFEHINAQAAAFVGAGQPAISVDTKKKEQVGEYKNAGRAWRPKGQPELVEVHDFGKQKDIPYGVYDLGRNKGWVSVGTDHDTSAFAVESIRRWWNMMGREAYPSAQRVLITADSGSTMTSWLTNGLPRQFTVMKENNRCSMRFHLLIAATTTRTGLRVQSQLDAGKYPKGIKVGKPEFAAIRLHPDPFHGDWNYTITPHS